MAADRSGCLAFLARFGQRPAATRTLAEPDLGAWRASVDEHVTRSTSGDRSFLLGWPADVVLPALRWFDGAEAEGHARCRGQAGYEIGVRRVTMETERARLDDLERKLATHQRRLGEAERLDGQMDQARAHPLISDVLGWMVVVAAGLADVIVLQTVFQHLDQNMDRNQAIVLGLAVSLIIMLGGVVVGRALRDRSLRRDSGNPPGPRPALLTAVIVVVGFLSFGIGALRASVLEPAGDAKAVFGISPTVAAAVTFATLQVAVFVIAIAAAYYAYRVRRTVDGFTRWSRDSAWRVNDVEKRVATARATVLRCETEIAAITEIFEAADEEVTAVADAGRARCLELLADAGGLAGAATAAHR